MTIGFDRRVRKEWIDAIAERWSLGATVSEMREFGHRLLRLESLADEARGKTLTVLFHLWVTVPANAVALRDEASKMFAQVDAAHRIVLHWGLGLATYPFFRDTAEAAGRLLALQDSVTLTQIQRRVAERWGQRSTAARAAQRIVRSWIDWGLLREGAQRGTYLANRPIEVTGPLALWLVEALLVSLNSDAQVVAQVRRSPQLFPFDLDVSVHDLRRAPRLAVQRQGVDEDVVSLRRNVFLSPSMHEDLRLL